MEFKENQKVWVVEKVMGEWVVNSGVFRNDKLEAGGKVYWLVDFSYIEESHIFKSMAEAKLFGECVR